MSQLHEQAGVEGQGAGRTYVLGVVHHAPEGRQLGQRQRPARVFDNGGQLQHLVAVRVRAGRFEVEGNVAHGCLQVRSRTAQLRTAVESSPATRCSGQCNFSQVA
ncbi:hypothetical protein ACFQT0_04400 [Hymenobacter humi]|uniref:Uncharacterized protein n=1 Tax=Hymenobacter humi TaxID=1411620 RepID=A0ABW2TZU9_9BACT